MHIKVEMFFNIKNTENVYEECDKIRKGLTHLIEENINNLVDDKSSLYNISVFPV